MQVNSVNAALGAKVADFRRALSWSQATLADAFGAALGRPMDATTITRLEQGKRPVAVHELIALSEIFSVEPTVFFKFLDPLDSAIKAAEYRASGADLLAQDARLRAELTVRQLDGLKALRAYRDTKNWETLIEGMYGSFAVPAEFHRSDWRSLLLDAGVPDDAISAAEESAGTGRALWADDESFAQFVMALLSALHAPKRLRARRR